MTTDPRKMDEVLAKLLKSDIFKKMTEDEKFTIITKSSSLVK
jgi:hypothetical protein